MTNKRNQGKTWLRKQTHILSQKKRRLTKSTKIYKSQTSIETVDTSKNNKTDTINKIDKSPGNNLSNEISHIEKTSEINIDRDNKNVYDLSRKEESLESVTLYQKHIPLKKKKENTRQFGYKKRPYWRYNQPQKKIKMGFCNRCRKI